MRAASSSRAVVVIMREWYRLGFGLDARPAQTRQPPYHAGLMTSVCFYFQVHQPFRLRKYSVFDADPFYFDNVANKAICEKVANKCYRPATAKILDLVRRHEGRFRVSYSISGVALEQFEQWCPDVLE